MSPGRTRVIWSHESDLNRRPAVYETAALPTELSWLEKEMRSATVPLVIIAVIMLIKFISIYR